MPDLEVPVLIVGSGLVRAHQSTHHGNFPRRRHRADGVRKSGEQFDQDGAIMAVETLAGKEPAWYIANLNERVRDVSPCTRVFITQSLLEPQTS